MSKIKSCTNGHNYDSDKYTECPYCPQSQGASRTIVSNSIETSGMRTVIRKNNIYDSSKKTVIVDTDSHIDNSTTIQQRTKIIAPETFKSEERKIVGFLVTYDIQPQGKVFFLFEGRNIIGSDAVCDILILDDPGVSGKHLTILYRNNSFMFKDEFSSNGTFIDGEMIDEGVLDKQCIIRIGSIRFYFIMVPFILSYESV
jgi:pSer/pThr/pTyr-binding forkhead associated (FHA) protein